LKELGFEAVTKFNYIGIIKIQDKKVVRDNPLEIDFDSFTSSKNAIL
jgi:hypothetical protein